MESDVYETRIADQCTDDEKIMHPQYIKMSNLLRGDTTPYAKEITRCQALPVSLASSSHERD
jgi:hypothetical protein